MTAPRVAIVGAGWAGLAAAVRAVRRGWRVTLFEAARTPGGRARDVPLALPGGGVARLDNGQHILIGAYTDTLQLMRSVGVDPARVLLRLPLTLRHADGSGLSMPRLPRPFDAAAAILTARGWRWGERMALLRAARGWQGRGFDCDGALTVAALCADLPERVRRGFIDPLCVAALNTPAAQASARVFLRVLHDALLGDTDACGGSSDLLLPRHGLGALLPDPALAWLRAHGADVRLGARVTALQQRAPHWWIGAEEFDQIILALPAREAARLLLAAAGQAAPPQAGAMRAWSQCAAALRQQAIATVYALADAQPMRWPSPMLALRSGPDAPAQFVFDHGALDGVAAPPANQRLLAFVISAAQDDGRALEQAVLRQAQTQLGLSLRALRTVVEKRATFACTPGLRRPPMDIAPALRACGDFIDGPYPATLEGAVRSGLRAAEALP